MPDTSPSSMQSDVALLRHTHFGMQQQYADTHEFDHFGQRAFVFLGILVFETRSGNSAKVAQDFPRVVGDARPRLAAEAEAAQKTAAPVDQRVGARIDGRFGIR